MAEQQVVQIAKVKGMYRCTGLGETCFREAGEILPPCSCSGGGSWELGKADNMRPEEADVVFVGRGILHTIETDQLPEVDHLLNIRAREGFGIETGKHRIRAVSEIQWKDRNHFHIFVERIGELADDLPIHEAVRINP